MPVTASVAAVLVSSTVPFGAFVPLKLETVLAPFRTVPPTEFVVRLPVDIEPVAADCEMAPPVLVRDTDEVLVTAALTATDPDADSEIAPPPAVLTPLAEIVPPPVRSPPVSE